MADKSLCSSCKFSLWCPTWGERKCVSRKIRFTLHGYSQPTKCSDYKKRDKNFKEPNCQCDDCLKNESLADELEEEATDV